MKKMLLILVMLFVATIAYSDNFTEIDYTVGCNDYKTVIGNLLIDYEEVLMFNGQAEKTNTALYANVANGSWTIVKYDHDKIAACVLAEGIGFDLP